MYSLFFITFLNLTCYTLGEGMIFMINHLSKSIALFFAQKNIISHNELDSYIYGFQLMLSIILNLSAIFLIMIYSGKIKETILYVASVFFLRHHTGGYHAKTPERCFIMTIGAYILILFIISTVTTELSIIISGLLVPSLIIILKLAPIVHKNNPIWEEALYRHRQYSIIISILIACAVIVFVLVKQYTLSLVLSLGIFQVSISLLVEKIKGGET